MHHVQCMMYNTLGSNHTNEVAAVKKEAAPLVNDSFNSQDVSAVDQSV